MMQIRQATYEDLREIARVHAICFPKHLSTRIGAGNDCYLLSQFYKEFINDCPELFVVAVDESDKVVGFCMGYYLDKAGQQSKYIHNNRLRVLSRIGWLMLKGDKLVWRKFKMRYRKPQFEILDHSIDNMPKSDIGDLLSICMIPEFRGKGYAQNMIAEFLTRMKAQGRLICLLSLGVSNARAKRFYERNGFTLYRKIGSTTITLMKRLQDE